MTRFRRIALGAALVLASGCAKKGPPSGGPPDLVPPRVVSTVPDSGAAGVALDAALSITFSEGMEPRVTGESVELAPRVTIRQRRWSGRTLTIVPGEALKPNQTYTLFVSPTARDRHGNDMLTGATIAFSTAAAFPAGEISGTVKARGFDASGTYLWCYDAQRTAGPDSTARDFDALGLTDATGHFSIPGLVVPARYRLWAFADLNGNRSFEPDRDVLVPADTVLDLTAEQPRISAVTISVVNPAAPARVSGTVLDTLADSLGMVRVQATLESDSTRRIVQDVGPSGAFDFALPAGSWRLQAFRDLDRNRVWKAGEEPASESVHLLLGPADELKSQVLVLRRAPGVPSPP